MEMVRVPMESTGTCQPGRRALVGVATMCAMLLLLLLRATPSSVISTRPHADRSMLHYHDSYYYLRSSSSRRRHLGKWVPEKVEGCLPTSGGGGTSSSTTTTTTQAQEPVQVQLTLTTTTTTATTTPSAGSRSWNSELPPCGQEQPPQQPQPTVTTDDEEEWQDDDELDWDERKEDDDEEEEENEEDDDEDEEELSASFSTTISTTTTTTSNNHQDDKDDDNNLAHYHTVVQPIHENNTVQVSVSVALPLTWNPFPNQSNHHNHNTTNTNTINTTTRTSSTSSSSIILAHDDQLAALLLPHIVTMMTNLFGMILDHAIDMHGGGPNHGDDENNNHHHHAWMEQVVLSYLNVTTGASTSPTATTRHADNDNNNDEEHDTAADDPVVAAVRQLLHSQEDGSYFNLQAMVQHLPVFQPLPMYQPDDLWDMYLHDVQLDQVWHKTDHQYAWWKITMIYPVLYRQTNDNDDGGRARTLGQQDHQDEDPPPPSNLVPVRDPGVLKFISRMLKQVVAAATHSGALLDNVQSHAASTAFVQAAQVVATDRHQQLPADLQPQDVSLLSIEPHNQSDANDNRTTSNNNNTVPTTTTMTALEEAHSIKGKSIVLAVAKGGREFMLYFFIAPGSPWSDGVWVPAHQANDYLGGDMELYTPPPVRPPRPPPTAGSNRPTSSPWGTYPVALGSELDQLLFREQHHNWQTRTKIGSWTLIGTVSLVTGLLLAAWLRALVRQRRQRESNWGSLATESDVNELLRVGWRCRVVEPTAQIPATGPPPPKLVMEIYERTNSNLGYHDDDSMFHGSSMPVPAPPSSLMTSSSANR